MCCAAAFPGSCCREALSYGSGMTCWRRLQEWQAQGVPHLRVLGKGSKVRYVPAHPLALERIHGYLEAAGHGGDADGPLLEAPEKPGGAGEDRLSRSPTGPFTTAS